jgi:fructose-1,6-bisphosphatase/inositol monophosphatase family enzyme
MRTQYEQESDLNIAMDALKKQFAMLEREYSSMYTLRKLSSTTSNITRIEESCLRKIKDYLVMNSVYHVANFGDPIDTVSTTMYWTVHTLDGIRNFAHKLNMVCSRVDLMHKNLNKCILSVIFAPFMKEFILCADGLGCRIDANRHDYGRRYVNREYSDEILIASDVDMDYVHQHSPVYDDNEYVAQDTKHNSMTHNSMHDMQNTSLRVSAHIKPNTTHVNRQKTSYINLHNNTMAIAYTACGYIHGFRMQNPSSHMIAVAKLYMKETNGTFALRDGVWMGNGLL